VTGDEVFFREWRARRPGERRSLDRARALVRRLGIDDTDVPIITVVGSKGKGTTSTYASAYLAAAQVKTVTVTSPALRSPRERLRVNGRAIAHDDLERLARQLDDQIRRLPEPQSGYLSPVGLYTVAGVIWACDQGADALVLEAGRGGYSDEVSLFEPTVVGITSIFPEHLGEIGRSIDAIATDKAGCVAPTTRAVMSLPQRASVAETLAATIRVRSLARLGLQTVPDLSSGLPMSLLPAGFGRANAELGICLAQRLLDVTTHTRPRTRKLIPVLRSVRTPGRLSSHRLGATEILVDSAIDRSGVSTALTVAGLRWTGIDHAVVCFPDHKDLRGAIAELGDIPVTFVRLPDEHLRFTQPLPGHWRVVPAEELTPAELTDLGQRVIALGTVYFTGRILDLVGADTERLFDAGDQQSLA
jgi:dihydrofolate synthase / folylpolyglutamate synthase